MKTVFVVDGHALCYRAYYAFVRAPLTNSSGQNTSAIFGFARMLLKLVQEQRPDYLAVAFDPPRKSFRFQLYGPYKANRARMPEDLRGQVEEIKQMVETLGIARLEVEGFEADDILGTVAERYGRGDTEVYLVTGDKDAYQLLSERVKIYANRKGVSEYELYDVPALWEKLGLDPAQVIDYMAITGDASDNVPGVKGIGEKGALKLITEFGSLDGVYRNIEKIKGKQRDLLLNEKEMAYLSRTLVTVRRDVPMDLDLERARVPDFRTPEARSYFERLEMRSIVQEFLQGEGDAPAPHREKPRRDYRTIRDHEELRRLVAEIRARGIVSVDTETTSVSPVEAAVIGMSFSTAEGEGWYLPLAPGALFRQDIPDREGSLEIVRPLLEDPGVLKVGQNIKYDLIVLRNEGIGMRGIHFDTMVASYLLTPNERRHNMDDLAEKYLQYRTITFKELVGTGKNAVAITDVPLERLAEYAAEDADVTWRLYLLFRDLLKREELEELFAAVEMPLVPVLADMEAAGVRIDTAHFDRLRRQNEAMLAEAEERIYGCAGQRFNINSTRELAAILFDKLGLKRQKKTKTGYSTDISVLESLQGSHEIIGHLISYRTQSKLKNTYIDSLPALISKKTGRIHTSYNQTVAATGRLSSSEPNLQNIPIRDEFGKGIRRGFVAQEGFFIMSADYSQIELRLAAHLSGDQGMIRAFREGIDIHSMTASRVFAVPLEAVTVDMRRQAKVINFATIYGVSPFGLSQQAEIGVKEAAEFIRIYFETYPRFREYVDATIAFAREHGYVKTMMGRKREVPDINSDVSFRREGAERIAINTPIQGTCADMIKIAMVRLHGALAERGMRTRMIMQVHDELVFEVPGDELETAGALVRETMETALPLSVPVVVDVHHGANWEEAH
ncbi:MAG: DNA polymerase I [Spirochaetes bacterium]|nr:DNA polymerase I [Spirochaetota bacterium]